MNIRPSINFSAFFERLINPIRRISMAWANSYKKAKWPLKIILMMVLAGVASASIFVPALLLNSIYNNTLLGTILADILDINDNGIISWWEFFIMPLSVLWFLILSAMVLLIWLIARGGYSINQALISNKPRDKWNTLDNLRSHIGCAIHDAAIALNRLIPARRGGEERFTDSSGTSWRIRDRVIVLRGAKMDRFLAFIGKIFLLPVQLFVKLGGQIKNLNKSKSVIHMSSASGSMDEIN